MIAVPQVPGVDEDAKARLRAVVRQGLWSTAQGSQTTRAERVAEGEKCTSLIQSQQALDPVSHLSKV